MEFDPQKLSRWIEEVIAQKRELAHLDFKRQTTSGPLLKDIVALYNTSDSPFEGLGLIIVGVTNTHDVVGLSEAELHSFPTASSREDSLVQLLRDNATPPPDIRVLELELKNYPGLRLHVVVVPESAGAWSMVHSSRAEQGHWIRHGAHSVRPKPLDYEKYLQRLVFNKTDALQQQLTGLQAAADEQRLQLTNLVVKHTPAEATNAQILRTAFRFPERTLVQTVRSEVNQYLAASGRLDHSALDHFGLDRQYEEHQLSADQRQAIKHSFEQLEDITRPLVELLGILAHDVPLPQQHSGMMGALEMALADIGNAALVTGPTPDSRKTSSPTLGALRAYPAIMLLFAAATVSVTDLPGRRWFVLERIFSHQRLTALTNGRKQVMHLASHWSLRQHLDYLVHLADRTHPVCAAVERLRDLMGRTNWLGTFIPASETRRLTKNAEVVTSLSYIYAGLNQNITPLFVPSAWMSYTDAQGQFESTLRGLHPHAMLSMAGETNWEARWRAGLSLLGEQMAAEHLKFRFGPLEAYDQLGLPSVRYEP